MVSGKVALHKPLSERNAWRALFCVKDQQEHTTVVLENHGRWYKESTGCLPEDAPLGLDLQDGWILYVFILQLLMYLGFVHSHRHLHLLKAFI